MRRCGGQLSYRVPGRSWGIRTVARESASVHFRLDGRSALVTGSVRGLGLEMARGLPGPGRGSS